MSLPIDSSSPNRYVDIIDLIPILHGHSNQVSLRELTTMLYRPLDVSRREIHILEIKPAPFDTPISCIIRTVSLDGNLSYETLSYVWGNPKITEEIFVQETSMVTKPEASWISS